MKYIVAIVSFGLCSGAALMEGKIDRYSMIDVLTGVIFAWAVISC